MEQAFKNMNFQPNVDFTAVMASYKKNLETIVSANQVAMEVLSSLGSLQSKFMQQTLEDIEYTLETIVKSPGSAKPEESLKVCAKISQESWSKAVNHGKSVADMMSKTGVKVSNLLRERVKEHMEESTSWMNAAKKTKH
jgi:phasin family protein